MREHLYRRLSQVLDYAELVTERLIVPEDDGSLEARKVASETAILLMISSRADDGRLASVIRSLGLRLAPYVRSRQVRQAMLAAPSRASWLGLAHTALAAVGLPDDEFEHALRLALGSAWAESVERPPHRLLDARWIAHLRDGLPIEWADVAAVSSLGVGIDLMTGSSDDIYALTHALFYATDFGSLPLDTARPAEAILADVEGCVAVALDADDFDLTGELLMAPALLRLPWTPVMTTAWHIYDAAWDRHGCVPAPGLDRAAHDLAAGPERDRIVLRDTYHTMHVAGLLCATLLSTNDMPPRVDAFPGDPDADELLTALAGQRSRTWLDELLLHTPGMRFSSLPLAVDAAARRHSIDGDTSALASVIRFALNRDLVTRSVLAQAIEYLDRMLVQHGASRSLGPSA